MTKGRRLLLQLLILPALYLASLPDPVLFSNVIFAVAFVTVPINATVAGILIWSSRQAPEVETLRERADDAVTLLLMSLATSGTALLSILARLGFSFPGRPTLAVLSWLAILIAIPAVGWLRTWRTVWLPIVRAKLAPESVPPATPPKGRSGAR